MKGIRKSNNRKYHFTVSMGIDGEGKVVRKYSTYTAPEDVSDTRADILAQEAYQEFKRKCKGNKNYNENMRFKELAESYFKNFAPNKIKESTSYNYEITTRTHLNPKFGNYKLKDITTAEISNFLTSVKGKSSTSRKIKIVLQSIFKYALTQNIINNNPCVGAIYKDEVKEDIKENYLSVGQARKLFRLVEEYSVFNTIIKVLLYTGMRSGECLGLRWDSINFEDKSIIVDKSLTYANNRWFLDTPKTRSSRRTITLDDELVEVLLKHKAEQDKMKKVVGDAWQHQELVFTSCTGHFYDRSLLNTQFRRFIKAHDEFPYITIHGLRHTNAALLIYGKEDIEVISKHLGHSSVVVTSQIYSHILAEVRVRVTNGISKALLGA